MKVNQSTPIKNASNINVFDIFNKSAKVTACTSAKGIRMLGLVEAGFASPVDEQLADIMHIEDYVMRDKDASFMLLVEDNSLEHLGICENDIVIFERGAAAAIGDLVVVLTVDGYKLVTLSRLITDEIIGIVVSVIRKYK